MNISSILKYIVFGLVLLCVDVFSQGAIHQGSTNQHSSLSRPQSSGTHFGGGTNRVIGIPPARRNPNFIGGRGRVDNDFHHVGGGRQFGGSPHVGGGEQFGGSPHIIGANQGIKRPRTSLVH